MARGLSAGHAPTPRHAAADRLPRPGDLVHIDVKLGRTPGRGRARAALTASAAATSTRTPPWTTTPAQQTS